MHVCGERADMLASRTARLVAMRRSERSDRKVAIVLFTIYLCLAVAFVVIGEFFRAEAFNWDWTLILGHPGLSSPV